MLKYSILIIVALLFLNSCSKIVYVDAHHVLDNKYDSEFPNVPTSDYLEEISQSIKLINIMVRYRVYDVPLSARVLSKNLDEDDIREIAVNETYISSPASGTGTIIFNSNGRIALLSCAHIFNFPDTITVNYADEEGNVLPFIQSIYYKMEQKITIPGLPEISDYDILATDFEKDICIIGKKYNDSKMILSAPLEYPSGKASELKPGTFVFVLGYPRGIQMVTRAIVGQANRAGSHNFLLDAAVHNGISGGPVFALRDGPPNFEMVGIVYAIAGEVLQFLGPEESKVYDAYKNNIYKGDVYLKSSRQIVYGVTYGLSMESIQDFFRDNYDLLIGKGFDSSLFLSEKETNNSNTN